MRDLGRQPSPVGEKRADGIERFRRRTVKVEDVTPQHPGEDRLANIASRYFVGLAKHAPEMAAKVAGTIAPEPNGTAVKLGDEG